MQIRNKYGRVYDYIAADTIVNRHGVKVAVHRWRRHCAQCGRSYDVLQKVSKSTMTRVTAAHTRQFNNPTWRTLGAPRRFAEPIPMPEATGYLTVIRCEDCRRNPCRRAQLMEELV